MHLIVGLGNIGEKYQLTRHNVGFMVIDEITKNLTTSNIQKSNFHSTLEKSAYDLYSKPTTFMNNSGKAVQAIKEYYKLDMEDIIVIHDDIDLPFGTVKFKIGGGHGGHNGLRSIDAHIGKEYIRVRIGVGKPQDKADVANYVLNNFQKKN
jgi:peptidyl-tRNA hydrolase, PTH1 family